MASTTSELAEVVALPIPRHRVEPDALVPVPAAHLARLLELEAALELALTYTPTGRSMRPGRVKHLRTAYERTTP